MRFVLGPIPRSRIFHPEKNGWTRLREPTSGVFALQALLLSLPFLIPAFAILPGLRGLGHFHPLALFTLVLLLVLMIPIHETIHALLFPGGLGSRHLIIGAWMRRGLCYVVYDSPLSRNRILTMLAMPFVTLSVLLILMVVFTPTEWRRIGILTLLIHTSVCTGDFATMTRLLRQTPNHALVLNDGWATWWKPVGSQTG